MADITSEVDRILDEDDLDENDQTDGAAGVEDAAATENESPELQAAREAHEKAQEAFEELERAETQAKLIQAYRELPEGQREGWLSTALDTEKAREQLVADVAEVERQEAADAVLANKGNVQALMEVYRAASVEVQAAVEERTEEDDPDTYRAILTEREAPVVEAPATEPAEEGKEPEPIDWRARWAESDAASAVPTIEAQVQYVKQGLADIKRGVVQVDPALREELESALVRADRYPDGNAKRTEFLEVASGIVAYVREEHEAGLPFGLGGVQVNQTFQDSQGTWMLRETDGRGMIRESKVEGGKAPSELGLLDEPSSDKPFDPDSIKTLEDARGLPADLWARIPEEKRDQLLRQASAAIEQKAASDRAAGLL